MTTAGCVVDPFMCDNGGKEQLSIILKRTVFPSRKDGFPWDYYNLQTKPDRSDDGSPKSGERCND